MCELPSCGSSCNVRVRPLAAFIAIGTAESFKLSSLEPTFMILLLGKFTLWSFEDAPHAFLPAHHVDLL
jgi:hypothetical protein